MSRMFASGKPWDAEISNPLAQMASKPRALAESPAQSIVSRGSQEAFLFHPTGEVVQVIPFRYSSPSPVNRSDVTQRGGDILAALPKSFMNGT